METVVENIHAQNDTSKLDNFRKRFERILIEKNRLIRIEAERLIKEDWNPEQFADNPAIAMTIFNMADKLSGISFANFIITYVLSQQAES